MFKSEVHTPELFHGRVAAPLRSPAEPTHRSVSVHREVLSKQALKTDDEMALSAEAGYQHGIISLIEEGKDEMVKE